MPAMPNLLSPTSPPLSSKAYTPLESPTDIDPHPLTAGITRNGTITYSNGNGNGNGNGKRAASSSSTISMSSRSSSDDDGHTTPSRATGYTSITRESRINGNRSGSEETLGPIPHPLEGDVGISNHGGQGQGYGYRDDGKMDYKGKGKGKAVQGGPSGWGADLEQGKPEEIYGAPAQYPPTNEEEAEEARIQANLARMAARDQARRRARNSKILVSNQEMDGGEGWSSSNAYAKRPSSMFSLSGGGGVGKRNSLLGLVDGIWGGSSKGNSQQQVIPDDGELPLRNTVSPPPGQSDQNYPNPYATRPAPTSPKRPPTMILSPASPIGPGPSNPSNPFRDPTSTSSPTSPTSPTYPIGTGPSNKHKRQMSITSPTSDEGYTYGYAGPGWRGGAAAAQSSSAGGGGGGGQVQVQEKPEKWWHAFCAWGADLDGGHGEEADDQAGRTNPFE